MNKFNRIFILLFALSTAGFISSCTEEDDNTGHSLLVPSSPTITVTGAGTMAPANESTTPTYEITLTMSEPQIVDVAVHIEVTGGTATEDADFALSDHRVIIPANKTVGSFTVAILSDDELEEEETFTITIGGERTANASIAPVTATFSIIDFDDDDLYLDLTWSTNETVFGLDGAELGAPDIADMIFTLVDNTGATVLESDGSGFESLALVQEDLTDGVYELRASFYGVIDEGNMGSSDYDINMVLHYSQGGVQMSSLEYAAAMNTALNCVGADYVTLASVTKAGATFTVENVNEPTFSSDNTSTIGTSYVELHDDGAEPSTSVGDVTMTTPDADGLFTVTNFGFSSDWWCAHPDATLDLVVDGTSILFPDGGAGATQAPGNLPDICGFDGVEITLNEVGSWNPCTGIISIDVAVRVNAGTFSSSSIITYTPL